MNTDTYLDSPTVAGMTQLTDYDEIREVLGSRKFVQGAYVQMGDEFLRGCLTMLDGPEHFARRRVVGKLFQEHAMAAYREAHLFPVIERTLAEIAPSVEGDGTVRTDLVPLVWRMLYRMAGAIAGIDGIDDEADAERFVTLVRGVGEAVVADWSAGDVDEVRARGRAARDAFSAEFFEPSLARREQIVAALGRGEIEKDAVPHDLLTMLALHREPGWDDGQLLRETTIFLIAATQTTAQAFPHFVVNLERWFEEHPDDRALVTEDQEFLPRAAMESLRFFVAAPARIRRAVEAVTLASGRTIAEGETVALLFRPANLQEDHFGDHADSYDPHREVEGLPHWGLAFGGGAHACVGRPLVMGGGPRSQSEGTIVAVARRLYAAGMTLDTSGSIRSDATTQYDQLESVPVRFSALV
jgi:cytochrome P450